MVLNGIKNWCKFQIKRVFPILSKETVNDKRTFLSLRYIRGRGVEIGALHFPLSVANGVQVKYVDRVTREESIKKFPELDASKIVTTHIIDDGFTLSTIPDASQDFLIANHVLEHVSNPLQVLSNWGRILKLDGILFVSVPIAEKCFDKDRPLTSMQHFIDDFDICIREEKELFQDRNKIHYRDWIKLSKPNILKSQGIKCAPLTPENERKKINEMLENSAEIHFHTFSHESYLHLLTHFTKNIKKNIKIIEILKSNIETIAVLQKFEI